MHLPALTSLLLGGSTTAGPNLSKPWSTWMASSFLSKSQNIDNHYVAAVIHEGIQKAATTQNDRALLKYASDAVSSIVSADGTLKGWNSTFYTLDDIRIGNNMLYFWNSEGRKDNKYVIAAKGLREQLNRWPRTPEGGFWHRAPVYANQMWLDGIYMADTFYATYTSYFEPQNITAWNDIELQFDLIEEHCRNSTTNLLYHGYSEDKSTVWADPETGASPYVWDRALGWYFVALVEVLEVWPKTHAGYSKLLNYYKTLASGIKNVQDARGGWYLLMDPELAGREGNYIESSATAMFTYSYLKGIRLGLLGKEYKQPATKAWKLLLSDFIQFEKNGTLSFTGTVTVGSLKGDASYEYYTGVEKLINDGKATKMSLTTSATSSAPSASSTAAACRQADFTQFPTSDAACAVGSISGVPSNTTDVLSKCCKSAPVEEFNGACGYYCLSFEQTIRELQTCFMENGARPGDILCNSNNSATATGTPSRTAGASRTSGSGASATGDSKGAAPAVGVSKVGLGMLGMVIVSAISGALL
ncbi:glycoside hydrolase family 105 protein [Bipolaris oryzae ATCC 44560]|uniref:Glycoside hydrolase family 105 protein n=1 Tax=Bipolaris oryzae ATCC 44560 TaxID=930090 RepID=W6Z6W8_COCMI|nr:glycoside hydrolase family 105 protein [Bipolaris oryzae ATCC 44560]EUC45543.1 glycoside hydrolase family 105 protein [Bipolaris oryzae ATCC 44560]